jgi:hypothetical protein
MMEIRPSPPTAPAPPVTPPTAVGRPIMVWGVAAGTLLAFISLLFQSLSGILVGLLIAVGAGVGGWWLTQREEETRHQRVLALLLHDPAVLVAQINASRDLDLERLRGMIKKQHVELTEPRAIRADLVRLSQSLTSLQLAWWFALLTDLSPLTYRPPGTVWRMGTVAEPWSLAEAIGLSSRL